MTESAPPVARRLAVGGLAALTLINLLNYLDRYVVSALVPALERAHMGLSDFRAGALMTGFLIVYMLTAPLFGILGDRASRTRAMAVGVLIWSLATGLSGLARNYVQLLLGRAVVGIGEAAYGTIAPALLADYFPVRSRGRVFAVFYMAIPVGSAFGYIVGGLAEHWFGWRAAFFIAGVPGIVLAWWFLRLPDPPRGVQEALETAAAAVPAASTTATPAATTAPTATTLGASPERAGLATFWRLLGNRPYLITVLGYAAYTFAVGGLAFWMPTFLERVRAVPGAEATTGFGAIVVVTGFAGTFAGGWLGDYWLKFSREAYFWISALTALLAVPLAAVALAAPAPALYYPAIVGAELLLFMSTGPVNSAIVNLVSPHERASAVALSVLLIHLLGDVVSPPLIGALSDRTSLGTAVLIVPAAVAACGALWIAAGRAARRSRVLAAA
ncbi:MAG: spinster family MFS transporter [Steroidobacteraceae bacterium]